MARRTTTTYGFAQTGGLLKGDIRRASESRGFAQSRVLTHWEEIAGADIAAISRPVEIKYNPRARYDLGRQKKGATLVLLTNGANAQILQMRSREIVERINAVYGYQAIGELRITQTAASGFAEGRVSFDHAPRKAQEKTPSPAQQAEAHRATEGVGDSGLREALERLGANVISRTQRPGR
ncbi:DciA family protein [Salipiger sp. 1_MG-2023]|uniref:DUF721 domain-containing protein n=1 Tax=Salipiger sp. 1_MG-2023 TaxID=3062665 RepID=UPI0026E423EB|nr:DciA family protein [Salipiger sp. 1_MG-2023]MDO6584372.1 DciA family protein [Salipiger sp. 1_MG-2023]